MRRDAEITESRRVPVRTNPIPLWRKLVTLLIAAAFTVVMISLGLMRHKHFRDDSPIQGDAATSQSGVGP
jgi:hypothetical protein